jgi:nitroreductase
MELMQAIRNRRSIRRFKPDAVSEGDIEAVMEAARLAPSWANTQCWKFVIVRDAKTRELLAETCGTANRGNAAIKSAPLLIVACAELGKSGYIGGGEGSDKGEWYMFDTAMAIHNLTLAAYSLGLGTLHIGWFDAKKAGQIVQVPQNAVVVELMPLGYPAGEVKPTTRKELGEILYYEKYGNTQK